MVLILSLLIMVRYHTINYSVKKDIAALIQKSLIKVCQVHSQALVYAAAVPSKSVASGESQFDKDKDQKEDDD